VTRYAAAVDETRATAIRQLVLRAGVDRWPEQVAHLRALGVEVAEIRAALGEHSWQLAGLGAPEYATR
jgi:hypothetical protein